MGKLRRLGKPPYLKPVQVENGDMITILEKPYIREEEKYGPRGYAVSKLERTREVCTVPFNITSWDSLLQRFGEDSEMWLNKRAKARKEMQTVRGQPKDVVFWEPYVDPQKPLGV